MIKDLLTPEKIQQIKTNPVYKTYLDQINSIIEKHGSSHLPDLKYSDYRLCVVTGNRDKYEKPYFIRRDLLFAYAIRYILYRNPDDLVKLQDIIWEICSEFTWALPSHILQVPDNRQDLVSVWIDLFAAETGASLAEIYDILKDEFESRINERIRYELNKRIVDSFAVNYFNDFENGLSNWAAVCSGSVGMTILYMAPEKFNLYRDRILTILNRYIGTFGENGTCEEGISYWNYGFSNYIYFADMLKEFSKGRINILNTPRVETIAGFGSNAYIRKNYTISYADGGRSHMFNMGLDHFLSSTFESVQPIYSEYSAKGLYHFFKDAIRTLLWINPDYCSSVRPEIKETESFESKLCWYVNKKANYSFTAKGGCNAEGHNHNDLGNFIVYTDNGQQIIDYGAPKYSQQYFTFPNRYTEHIVACSRGHNVPVINGVVQEHGGQFRATSPIHENDRFVLDLSKAYPECGMTTYTRDFTLGEDTVAINDKITFTNDKNTIEHHFISFAKPEISGNTVKLGEAAMTCPENGKITFVEEKVRSHNFEEALGNYDTIYITKVLFECGTEFDETFVINIK